MRLLDRDGVEIVLEPDRWHADADEVEQRLLDGLVDPVLDIGCGPGRLLVALAEAGRRGLGVDGSPAAVELVRSRGAAAVCRSVFDALPGEGRWPSAVLLDGNIGIGGDPVALLRRVHDLLAPGGRVVVEVGPPGSPTDRLDVRLDVDGDVGTWFPWARVGASDAAQVLLDGWLLPEGLAESGGRWFARGVRP